MKKKPNRILISSLLMAILCIAALALIATLPGGGWWFGAQVQNVSSGNAVVTYTIYDYDGTPTPKSRSDPLVTLASKNYGLTDFNLANNFQGSSIVSSNWAIRAIVNLTNRGITVNGMIFGDYDSPSPAAGQYQGAIAADTQLWFPLVKNQHYNKSTTIIVQNVGTANTTATVVFRFPNWTYTYYTPTLKPGQMAAIEPINAHSGQTHPPTNDNTNSVGSVTVTSSQPLAGVALEHMTMEDHATVLQATRGFISSDASSTIYAPINKNNSYGRFTGLQVMNVSGHSIDITVYYTANPDNNPNNYCPGGTPQDTWPGLADKQSHTFSSSVLPNHCFASAKIEATGNIVGMVNESFTQAYLDTHPGHAQEATAYNAIGGVVTKKLSAPLFKENSYSKGTGLSIMNVGQVTATNVVIKLTGPTGTYTSNPLSINSGSAYVAMDLRLKPASFWNGTVLTPAVLGCQDNTTGCGANGVFSVIVTSDQNIVGVANESTYPNLAPLINQDKSNYEAFNLTP
jgi:hypothetical protein